MQTAKMATYVFGWYAFNIVFNILNKSALNVFPAPWFIATLQLVASALFMVGLWATGLHPVPRVSWPMIRALLPVALFHTIGHVSACVSFSQMAVSFAHVVKSAEPVLSVALSQALLGEFNPWYVWLSLLPIIAGCSLAAMKEVSFAWNGFNNAMISNLGMVLRNVYSKKSLGDYKNSLDGINLFALLSILSLIYLIPAALFMEGFQGGAFVWKDMYAVASATYGPAQLVKLLALSGVFYHLYNQASYMVLGAGISPVTFSVGNTMKRVAVVASSILFFRNPVSALNWIGSLVAMLGTGLYSAAKQKATNDAAKSKSR
ncbi:triose-phosphate transporter [Helicosporidium sp. ATCC 50920]|nr:triose-phosphate transporter [Helicosporidium sp. ATCC 50920]|eukprot:KDD73011.1 triose-phosphate transporter [Helicosporidium sp. ATCC 50920]